MSGRDASAQAESVEVGDAYVTLRLVDGRILQMPVGWFNLDQGASEDVRRRCQLADDGWAILWPDLDVKISVQGLLIGRHHGGPMGDPIRFDSVDLIAPGDRFDLYTRCTWRGWAMHVLVGGDISPYLRFDHARCAESAGRIRYPRYDLDPPAVHKTRILLVDPAVWLDLVDPDGLPLGVHGRVDAEAPGPVRVLFQIVGERA